MKRVFLGLVMVLALGLALGSSGCTHASRSRSAQTFVLAVTVKGQQPTPAQWALVKAQISTTMAARGWRPVDDLADADQIVRVEFVPDPANPETNGEVHILSVQPNPVGPLVLSGRSSPYPAYAAYDPYPSNYRYYGYYSWGWDYPFGYDWSYPYAYGYHHGGRHHSSGSSDAKPAQPPEPGNQPKPRPPVSSDDRPRPPRDRWGRRPLPDSPGGSSSGGYSSGSSSSSSGSSAYSGSSSSSSGSSDSGSSSSGSSGSSGSSFSGSSDSGSSSGSSSMNTSHSYGNSRQPD